MHRSRVLLLVLAAAIGIVALWAMVPPRVTELPPSAASPAPLATRNSELGTPTILPTDPVRGRRDAPLTIIEFADFSCPACAEVEPVLRALRAEYGNRLAIVW